jgi:hypothetical protein
MTKIVDPDQLNQSTEVVIDTGAKTIQLLVAGNLSDVYPGATSGVTLQALYSFLKEEWKDDTDLNKFRFPIKMYTKTDGTFQNGWALADAQSRQLIRDAGWTEVSGDKYAGIISLGNFDEDVDQAYYQQVAGFDQAITNFDKSGNLNESILIYNHTGPEDFTDYLKTFLREQGKLYASYNLIAEQGLAELEPVLYRLPLSNAEDLKINETDGNIDSQAPYTSMEMTYLKGSGFTEWATGILYPAGAVVQEKTGSPKHWYFTAAGGTSNGTDVDDDTGVTDWVLYEGEEQIGTDYYAFNRVIDGNGASAQEIYNWAMRQLRKDTDINADTTTDPDQGGYGTVYGQLAIDLVEYVGDTLKTMPGVLIRNFDINDRNDMVFRDITVGYGLDDEDVPLVSTDRSYPFVAAGNLNFSANLVAEEDAKTIYSMYFLYITRKTGADLALADASGSDATLTSSTTSLSYLQAGDFIKMTGWTNPENNGIWSVVQVNSANDVDLTKEDGQTVQDETSGPTITIDENPFDSEGAIVVDDESGTDILDVIDAASISFDFDYTNNNQGGRTPNTDASVVVVAQGLEVAEWISVEATITQSTGIEIAVTANDERNYANPA